MEPYLIEYLPGKLLGDVSSELSNEERDRAWSSSGAALRRAHTICFPEGDYGVIVGDQVVPAVDGSWGEWQVENLLYHAHKLTRQHGIQMDTTRLDSVLKKGLPSLNESASFLLHNDPHPWNVLVDENLEWSCSGWLDWEYAWVGDRTWDLVRMDVWRMCPMQTPESFWEGYGEKPKEPNRSIYQMSIYLWQASEELNDPSSGPRHTRGQALKYLKNLDSELNRLECLVS